MRLLILPICATLPRPYGKNLHIFCQAGYRLNGDPEAKAFRCFPPSMSYITIFIERTLGYSFAWFNGWLFGRSCKFRKSVPDGRMSVTDLPVSTALSSLRR